MNLIKYDALNKKIHPWCKNVRKPLKIAHINFSKKKIDR